MFIISIREIKNIFSIIIIYVDGWFIGLIKIIKRRREKEEK